MPLEISTPWILCSSLTYPTNRSFTCDVRHLTAAYGDPNVYAQQYSVTPGWHGTDLLSTFYKPSLAVDSLAEKLFFNLVPLFEGIA
jgi:hypothetical protein